MTSLLSSNCIQQAEDAAVFSDVSLLQLEVAIMSARFAALLRQRFANDFSAVAISLSFLDFRYREICGDTPLSEWQSNCITRISEYPECALYKLIHRLKLNLPEVEMLIIAGLAEEHEGFADIFRTLHPTAKPLPSIGLVAQIISQQPGQRFQLRQALETGKTADSGIFIIDDEPFYTSSIRLCDQLWSLLQGIDAWPKSLSVVYREPVLAGLEHWLAQPVSKNIQSQLSKSAACTLMMLGESAELALDRALALCAANNLGYIIVNQNNELNQQVLQLLQLHCLIRGVIPILKVQGNENPSVAAADINFSDYPAPVIMCADFNTALTVDNRPLISLRVETLKVDELRNMWRTLLPELAQQAEQLAARYPLEPAQAKLICDDIRFMQDHSSKQMQLSAVASAVRTRSIGALSGAITIIYPAADWSQLVLPQAQLMQLQEASGRLLLQSRVLDDWKFLKDRRGARGVRMLFSGPSGTGKTLSAEVLANALGVDLLQVDLSRVVSKWIGETEKNLAEVFLSAESTKSVLFFDEADALFGKRTEVSDAHDRYANLETAYLLSRLESYDGLAILATNYRQNIDAAFTRRLEFIVEFEEPDAQERLKLWQCHIPDEAPLDDSVSLQELAMQFPIVGGHIRNAAVAAAFLAAQENTKINRQHLFDAIRREYEKSSKAYREISTR